MGPEPTENLAGSAIQRVLIGAIGGRPTPADPDRARTVIELAANLAHEVPVLHDVSDGGLAVAVAEICIASGVGAVIDNVDDLFSEDPHRFVMVVSPGTIDLPDDLARRVGVLGGDSIVFGNSALPLDEAADAWHGAIPRALGD